MKLVSIFEYESVYDHGQDNSDLSNIGVYGVSSPFYGWIKKQCLGSADTEDGIHWLKLRTRGGREVIQFAGYVGVLRSPVSEEQIEILPKIGLSSSDRVKSMITTRRILIKMLASMRDFRHFKTGDAVLETSKHSLLEVFIYQFLLSVDQVVRRGLRNDYVSLQDNLFALRGKLLISQHIKHNIVRRDRFFTEHDEYSPNRPENRLIGTALIKVISYAQSNQNQKLARELGFVFNEIPSSVNIDSDLQKIRLDRGMEYYQSALAWSCLILKGESPLTGSGTNTAVSLLFPMADIFEEYVARKIEKELSVDWSLKKQSKQHYLVEHDEKKWFQLKPDMLISDKKNNNRLVLDTKWKLLDISKDKYGLSQGDFYQMFAYGHTYLEGTGDVILIYPASEKVNPYLNKFAFCHSHELPLNVWVTTYDLDKDKMNWPFNSFDEFLRKSDEKSLLESRLSFDKIE